MGEENSKGGKKTWESGERQGKVGEWIRTLMVGCEANGGDAGAVKKRDLSQTSIVLSSWDQRFAPGAPNKNPTSRENGGGGLKDLEEKKKRETVNYGIH